VIRVISLLGGLAGATALSQFPEFSQQYLQRLGGQADALAAVVEAFDASATEAGLTREAALADLSGTTFRNAHQEDMRRTILRAAAVEADLALLRAAAPLERLTLPHRFRDGETLAATWADFRPAVPVTADGLASGGIGFVTGWAVVAFLLRFLTAPFRRQRYG
jgi:hypothetical protein